MKRNIRRLIIKCIVFIVICNIFEAMFRIFGTVVLNMFAVNSMDATAESYIMLELYNQIHSWGWMFYLFCAFICFRKDIASMWRQITQKKEGNNNETE